MHMTSRVSPQVWLGCVAARAAGLEHGVWCDADADVDLLDATVSTMLATSPATASAGYFVGSSIDMPALPQDATLESIAAVGEFVAEHGPIAVDLLDHLDCDVETAQSYIDDGIVVDDVRSYVQKLFHQRFRTDDRVAPYVDWDLVEQDVMPDIDVVELSNGSVLICPL